MAETGAHYLLSKVALWQRHKHKFCSVSWRLLANTWDIKKWDLWCYTARFTDLNYSCKRIWFSLKVCVLNQHKYFSTTLKGAYCTFLLLCYVQHWQFVIRISSHVVNRHWLLWKLDFNHFSSFFSLSWFPLIILFVWLFATWWNSQAQNVVLW